MRKAWKAAVLIALLLAGAVQVFGQESRARIQGFVSDPTRAAVAGASVTLMNQGTNIAATRTSGVNGLYLFDLVQPGNYTVTVESPGFKKFKQMDILVQTRADVTIDAVLQVGDMTQAVEVTADPTAVEFNTGTMSQTVSGKMLEQMPVIARSPFTLAILNPAVVNNYWDPAHNLPFYQISHNGSDIGGQTGGRNQLLLDGVDTRIEQRGSYSPTMDSVQEFVVQQNPIDAEYGNGAGGAISITMKSGTNELHGTGYYFGRNPYFNAVTNAITREPNKSRNHIGGAALGGPVLIPKVYNGKNKAFWFFSFENWKSSTPGWQNFMTVPTDLERQGDFSRTLNVAGAPRTIYDPMTTVLDPETGAVTRTPFTGNRIPSNRIDTSAAKLMGYVWKPNNPGEPVTGLNNWKATPAVGNPFTNISVRGDYNFTDKWRVFGRYSRQNQWQKPEQPEQSPAYFTWDAGKMYAMNLAGSVDGTLSPTTIVNFRFGYIRSADEFNLPFAQVGKDVWKDIWPNQWWNQTLSDSSEIYFPSFGVDGASFGGVGGWNLRPRQYNYSGTLMKQFSSHYMKFGAKLSHYTSNSVLPDWGQFNFTAATTSSTFINSPTEEDGYGWASFLLGYPNGGYTNYSAPIWTTSNNLGIFFQDDWKLTRNLTLNLGLRYEFDQAPREQEGRLGRFLDLNNPIPEFKSTPPNFPDLSAYGVKAPLFNGAYEFLDDQNQRMFRAPRNVFLPRIGVAYRVNDKTSIRAGYARYGIPFLTSLGPNWNLPNPGFSQRTDVLDLLTGKPRTILNDPFPASSNPVQAPVAKSLGRYHQLGNPVTFFEQNPKQPMNDRFNVSFQRVLPLNVRLDVTFFMNVGHNVPVPGIWGGTVKGEQENLMNPALWYQYKSELEQTVANPFYNYLTPDKFPGGLRYQETVQLSDLMSPYPQYGGLTRMYTPGAGDRYRSMQIKLEKAFAKGLAFTFGYNYGRTYRDEYFNSDDQYARKYSMVDTLNYRHKLTIAPYWELPFGKGRTYAARLHPVLDALVGGWTTSHLFQFNTGNFLYWGQLKVTGDPVISNPGRDRWFNTEAFAPADPYTPRTNPRYYEGLTGPLSWNLDSTLAKNFQITEKARLELRMESFNLPNHFLSTPPNQDVRDPQTFGRSLGQSNYGREMQYTIRLHF